MSWVQAAQSAGKSGDQGDVFDEDADESLVVQREWRSHMQRRVKVKRGGGSGGPVGADLGGPGFGAVTDPGSERPRPGFACSRLPRLCSDFPVFCVVSTCHSCGLTKINFIQTERVCSSVRIIVEEMGKKHVGTDHS